MPLSTNHAGEIFLSIIDILEEDSELFMALNGGMVGYLPKHFERKVHRGQLNLFLSLGNTDGFDEVDFDDREKLNCCVKATGADPEEIQLATTTYNLLGAHILDCNSDSAEKWVDSLTEFETMVTGALRNTDKLGIATSVTDWNLGAINRYESAEDTPNLKGCSIFEIEIEVEHIFDRPDSRCV